MGQPLVSPQKTYVDVEHVIATWPLYGLIKLWHQDRWRATAPMLIGSTRGNVIELTKRNDSLSLRIPIHLTSSGSAPGMDGDDVQSIFAQAL